MEENNDFGFDAEDLMLLASAEITADRVDDDADWRQAPLSGLKKTRQSLVTDKGVFETPYRVLPPPFHFLGGSYDDPKVAKARFKRLSDSPWKVVDVETTGRTPYSLPVKQGLGEQGRLRCRIVSATWTNADGTVESAAWDIDTMEDKERIDLAKSCLSNTFIAHNAAFDIGWLLHMVRDSGGSVNEKLWPKQVLCTLHLGRQLYPESRRDLRIAANNDQDPRTVWIKERLLGDRGKDNWGSSLEDVTYALNLPWATQLDKSYQKPYNWVPRAPLSPKHYQYVQDDALLPAVIVHRLMTDRVLPLGHGKTQEQLTLEAAQWLNENVNTLKDIPKVATYFNVHHDAVKHVVNVSQKGMPYDLRLSKKYRQAMLIKLNAAVDKIDKEPSPFPQLVPFIADLRDTTKGSSAELTAAWVATFKEYDPQVQMPYTRKGELSLSAKDLRRVNLDKGDTGPVYELLNDISRSKQAVKMIDNLDSFVERAIIKNGEDYAQGVLDRGLARLHPLLGFGPGTDRLSSNDPNAQNLPADPNFRALVRARPGYKIIACDYGQIELRIAAGLALRAQDEFNKIMANPEHVEPTSIGQRAMTQLRKLWTTLETAEPARWDMAEQRMMEDEKSWDGILNAKMASFGNNGGPRVTLAPEHDQMSYQKIKDERDLRRLMIFAVRIFRKRKEFGTNMFSALAIAFREGIDPHLFTGLAMAQQNGVDIGGADPLTVIRTAMKEGPAAVDALKEKFKKHRQNAKAVNFGLLYGMTPPTLHMTGIVNYRSTWSPEEAHAASDAWFGLYPELGFWQYFTILRPEWEGQAQVCKTTRNGPTVDSKELRSWRVTSLYGREYVREAFREALNYQDQGTGAHMVFKAMSLMPKDVRACLIDQIHDEILAEVPDEFAEKYRDAISTAMVKAAKEALGKYNVPVTADAEIGEVWVHGDPPTIPLDPDVEMSLDDIAKMDIPEEQMDPTEMALA